MRSLQLFGAVALLGALGGCRFWYKPVPVENAIGEAEMTLAGDSVNVYRDTRFEVYGPNSEAVFDGYEQLNRAYRAFERYFGAPAPKLAFLLYRDSVQRLDAATEKSFRDRGFTLVYYTRPGSVRRRRRTSAIDYGGVTWPIAPTAARTLLARFGDLHIGGGSGNNSGNSVAVPRPDDMVLDRYPLWFRAAVIHLVGEAGALDRDIDLVRDKRAQLIPIRDLVVNVRAASGDSLLDPSRRGEADETTQLLAAQSATLARFLVEREGPAVIGRLGRGYLSGRTIAAMLAELHSSPRDIAELERRWRAWIESREN